MLRKFRVCAVSACVLLMLAGCGGKSEVKTALNDIELSGELPSVKIVDCRSLAEADEAVYDQQIAACEMYYEAYDLTRTSKYIDEYVGDQEKMDTQAYKKTAYYCNARRKELQLDIATQLNDNVYAMVRSVEDCDNIAAYLKRVNYDTVNFYDYYMAFINSGGDSDACCNILTVFYEKTNILALKFMDENREDITLGAVERIVSNAAQTKELNMYIAENNEIIKALNKVYGGVPAEYSEVIMQANRDLARKLLEEDNDLSEDEIEKLMNQLGEPTPSPEPTEEPTETPEPTEKSTSEPTEKPTAEPTQKPVQAERTPVPARTQAPATQRPIEVTPTPEVYIFGE